MRLRCEDQFRKRKREKKEEGKGKEGRKERKMVVELYLSKNFGSLVITKEGSQI
jgi:hypothetical protein